MAGDIFGNPDVMGTATGGAGNLPVPAAVPTEQPTGNPQVNDPLSGLLKLVQMQQKVVMPPLSGPQHVQAGDTSGLYVNPSTVGGPKHNARVALAQSIGKVAEAAVNAHEDKQARELAYKINRVESLYNTINDPNATEQQKSMAKQELNQISPADWKKIQKATGIQVFAPEDKRTPQEKKAMQIAQQSSDQGKQQINNPAAQQGGSVAAQQRQNNNAPMMQETNGIPQGIPQQGQNNGLNPMAAAFLKKLATITGMTPAAQAAAELTKAGVIPNAGEILRYASDQQYYKVMEEKLGAEQAAKFAKIQEDMEYKYAKLEQDYQKEQDVNNRKDLEIQMREIFHNGYNQIQEARIGLMKDQLDEKIRSDKSNEGLKASKEEVDKLGKQAQSLNQQTKQLQDAKKAAQKIASTGITASKKQKDAVADIQTIDQQLQRLQQQQQQVQKKLEGYNQPDTSSAVSPELDDVYKKLIDKYMTDQPAAQSQGRRQTL